jgi:hypothetical protein
VVLNEAIQVFSAEPHRLAEADRRKFAALF